MGSYACYEDIVEESFIKEQSPEQFQKFLDALEKAGMSLETFAQITSRGVDFENEVGENVEDEQDAVDILNTWSALCIIFVSKTDLGLGIGYKEKEDRGDEVDGVYWSVDGVYELTKAGRKWESKICRKFWTNWG